MLGLLAYTLAKIFSYLLMRLKEKGVLWLRAKGIDAQIPTKNGPKSMRVL